MTPKNSKIISWNVNGIRAAISKGLPSYFSREKPDFLCLQEVKALEEQVDHSQWPDGYQWYWNPAKRKGYSGVATFTKHTPVNVIKGIGIDEHDQEGRVITLEMDKYYLVNVYTPNSQNELARLDYRVNQWDVAFRDFLSSLHQHKPVVFCGDLNVAHEAIDLANPKSNRRNAGFTDEERNSFSKLIDSGFVDSFRHFNKAGGHYTWWSYRGQARAKNVGWRIDYFCVSDSIKDCLVKSTIHQDVLGSDHCPVELKMKNPK